MNEIHEKGRRVRLGAESKMDGGMDDNHRKEKLSDASVRAIAAVGGYTISSLEEDLDSVDITIC